MLTKVVCIDVSDIDESWFNTSVNLTYGKVYSILKEDFEHGSGKFYERYYLCDDNGEERHYYSCRFISLKEYRKRKLKEIYESR